MSRTRYRWWLTLRIWVLIIFTIATALQSADILHGWVSHNRWLLWFGGYVFTCLPPTIFQCSRFYLWEILLTILILFFWLCIVSKQRMFFKVVYNCFFKYKYTLIVAETKHVTLEIVWELHSYFNLEVDFKGFVMKFSNYVFILMFLKVYQLTDAVRKLKIKTLII